MSEQWCVCVCVCARACVCARTCLCLCHDRLVLSHVLQVVLDEFCRRFPYLLDFCARDRMVFKPDSLSCSITLLDMACERCGKPMVCRPNTKMANQGEWFINCVQAKASKVCNQHSFGFLNQADINFKFRVD